MLPLKNRHWIFSICAGCLLFLSSAATSNSATPEELNELYLSGEYEELVEVAREELEERTRNSQWRYLLVKSLMMLGRYEEAVTELANARLRLSSNLQLWFLEYELRKMLGETDRAEETLREIDRYASPRIQFLQEPDNLVTLGRAVLEMGAEPKLVLNNFFRRAQSRDAEFVGTFLAMGQLALDKNDFQLAAENFREGLKIAPNHPDLHYGLGKSFANSDRTTMLLSLNKALELNENHIPSLLQIADHLIDAEEYEQAGEHLDRVLEINPWRSEAWAYRAAIAHLQNDPGAEQSARNMALTFWDTNPEVDYLIGKKLSLHYRFREGAAYQEKALAMKPDYLPSQIQLAQDLLRLGREEKGWELATAVHEADGYDVTAFNLTTLRDQYRKFATITNEHFIVRMDANEAEVFGDRVLDLLSRAHETLTAKYDYQLDQPTLVEMFADPRDFGVRTFGMPLNPGFLGVCFGDVITANSPSQAGSSANWEAVLWHEFCHVITLNMTRNKMPRWLSEGISVYEELQENSAWGQRMTPEYRLMILGEKLTPVSDLSAAFLRASENIDLQFAYYESAMVVEYLIRNYGFDSLRNILLDLGRGEEINDAIARHTQPIDQIDKDFAKYARDRARELGPELEWEKPETAEMLTQSVSDLLQKDIDNYWLLKSRAQELMQEDAFEEALPLLEMLAEKYPDDAQPDSSYRMMASIHREMENTEKEMQALKRLAALDANRADIFQRLTELTLEQKDWEAAWHYVRGVVAVNPMLSSTWRDYARIAEQNGEIDEAIEACYSQLALEPQNPSQPHFHLARLMEEKQPDRARRHVLQALEEAPRFRDAHRLLLRLAQADADKDAAQ